MVYDAQVTILFIGGFVNQRSQNWGAPSCGDFTKYFLIGAQNRKPKAKKTELPSNAENLVVKNGELIIEINWNITSVYNIYIYIFPPMLVYVFNSKKLEIMITTT